MIEKDATNYCLNCLINRPEWCKMRDFAEKNVCEQDMYLA